MCAGMGLFCCAAFSLSSTDNELKTGGGGAILPETISFGSSNAGTGISYVFVAAIVVCGVMHCVYSSRVASNPVMYILNCVSLICTSNTLVVCNASANSASWRRSLTSRFCLNAFVGITFSIIPGTLYLTSYFWFSVKLFCLKSILRLVNPFDVPAN